MAHHVRGGAAALVVVAGCAAGAWGQPDAARSREPVVRYDGHKVLRVEVHSAKDLLKATALAESVWSERVAVGQAVDIEVSPEQLALVGASGLRFRIINENVQASIDAETAYVSAHRQMDDPTWYTNYHNYDDVKAYYQGLAAMYPDLAAYQVIGMSLQGREIFALRITGPGGPGNRPASVWIGGQHAREWINVPVPTYHAEQLLTRYATDAHVQRLVNNQEFIFIPIMNPDGYDYTWTTNRMWRKNRRQVSGSCYGVDLNRNWGYQWGGAGSSGQCSNDTYRGTAGFSEPETQVMRDFITNNPRVRVTMDWHSYSQLVMSPWGYTSALPTPASVAQQFQSLDDQMAAAILSTHGVSYAAGPIYTTIYPAAGTSVDWAYGARGVWAFTIELRDTGQYGFTLPANQITPTCEETWAAFLLLADFNQPACYANCDGSTAAPVLNVNDFICFQNRFAAGDTWANCDGSTAAPVLNVNDFVCFQGLFAGGCE